MINNGHTVEVEYAQGGYIEVDGQRYDIANIHYHLPSEHTINGEAFDAELHLVHTRDISNNQKEYAVVGILLKSGAANPAYDVFLAHLPAKPDEEFTLTEKIDATTLLPSIQTTYRYTGSLTTPPCTAGVRWHLMANPVELSTVQLGRA